MSRFDKCPVNDHNYQLTNKYCDDWLSQNCEGCPTYCAYQIGRADATKEVLDAIKSQYKIS